VTIPRVFRQSRFVPPADATEILLVRHGESDAYTEGETVPLFAGQDDPPLAPEGRLQAEWLADRLAGERFDAIYVTSLRRTVETAAPLAFRSGIEPVVEPDLREVYLGEWEGGSFRQRVADGDPLAIQMRAEERWDVVPGAESTDHFRQRVGGAIERITERHRAGRVIAVCHAGTIATTISMASGARPFAFLSAAHASISKLVVSSEGWQVRSFNDTSHLKESE
jgi:probable phosphoglycerate mutase